MVTTPGELANDPLLTVLRFSGLASQLEIEMQLFRAGLRSLTVAALAATWASAVHAGPAVGEPAPAFRLQDQSGAWHTLDQYRGRWVALYFYPKDGTPGCTTEACAFRDNIFTFEEMGAVVLGVSLDDVESHAEFAEKHSLPFSLLADVDGKVADAYGVLGIFGSMRLAKRQSFVIDPDGNIALHYGKVDPDSHSEDVLADLKRLIGARSET